MIHRYCMNGLNIVLDVESGAVHVLDSLPYEILSFYDNISFYDLSKEKKLEEACPEDIIKNLSDKYTEEDITDAYSELKALQDMGLLFSDRDYDITLETEYPVKALCLHISHDCNLRCKYCFAEGGDFAQGRKLMPFETAKNAIDFVTEMSGSRVNIEVDFFGGEPLMNFETVKKTVEYARGIEKEKNKRFRFTLTTNGVLLDNDVMDFLNKEMSNVVLSLDGRKSVNDKVRVRSANLGSYDRIVPKFQEFVKRRNNKNYYVRGTFTSENLDFSKDVMHMRELGFSEVSVEPVVLDKDNNLAISEDMLDDIFAEYERLSKEIIELHKSGEKFNFFHFMVDLDQGPCVIKRIKGCGSGAEYVAVTPDGDIYPCHRFAGMPEFKMGNVNVSYELNKDIRRRFSSLNVLTKPECGKCFAKYYCSGGCAANNYNENHDLEKPHKISCELERKRLECAIMIKAAESSGSF